MNESVKNDPELAEGLLLRLAAFTDDPSGGNPAGVWLGLELPTAAEMQRIAAEVGYSETAFLAPIEGGWRVRYYSPQAEVPFCGHATVASGAALGRRYGAATYRFETAVGEVPVDVTVGEGAPRATLTSVAPEHRIAPFDLVADLLRLLRWSRSDLDPELPPALAYAGAWHFVVAAGTRERLAALDYGFEDLETFMLERDLTTIQLVWRESPTLFHSRNPFPVGGVVEDPATGAAAAALGGYLRDAGRIEAPTEILIRQGEDMGRPSRISVEIPVDGGIRVTGNAVVIS